MSYPQLKLAKKIKKAAKIIDPIRKKIKKTYSTI